MSVRPVENKGAEGVGGVDVCVIAQSIKETDENSLVNVQRGLSQPTVSLHPQTKFSQRRPEVTDGRRIWRKRKLTPILKKPDE
jgi:hypothetical protein